MFKDALRDLVLSGVQWELNEFSVGISQNNQKDTPEKSAKTENIKTPAFAGVFLTLHQLNYFTVVVALRFIFQTFSPVPFTNGRSLP